MRLASALLVVGSVLLSSAAAHAGEDALSIAERAHLSALVKDALADAKKGNYEAARVGYQKAYDIFPTSAVLFNLALSELRSGHSLEALHHFDMYTAMDDADAAKVHIVKTDLRPKAYAETGHILIEGAAPAGAHISVDGRELADADARLVDVAPGDHEVVARTKDGTWRANVTAQAGQNTSVSFQLVARAGTPAVAPAQSVVTPAPAPVVAPASRPVPVEPMPAAATHSLAPDVSEQPKEASFWTGRRVVAATMAGTALVAAGAGLFFFVQSNSSDSHAADLRAQLGTSSSCRSPVSNANQASCADLSDSVNQAGTYKDLSTGLFVAGGALAVGSVLTYVLWPSSAESKRGTIVPVVDPSSRMGGVVGRFVF
jgi:hypothetical protein